MCVGEGSAIGVHTRKMAASNCKPGPACVCYYLFTDARRERLRLSLVPCCVARSVGAVADVLPFSLYLERFQ